MSPPGCQKMLAKPCNQNAEERFPVHSLKSQAQKPPNPLLIQDKNILQPSLEPPSIRASHYEDWAPNTAYARGVMITGHLKRPICQNGGSSPGAFTGTSSNWSATSMRGV